MRKMRRKTEHREWKNGLGTFWQWLKTDGQSIVKKEKRKERTGTTHNVVLFNKNLIYCSQQTISIWCLLITNILINYPPPPPNYKGRFPGSSSNMQSHHTIESRLKTTTTKPFESFALGVSVSVVLGFGKRQVLDHNDLWIVNVISKYTLKLL